MIKSRNNGKMKVPFKGISGYDGYNVIFSEDRRNIGLNHVHDVHICIHPVIRLVIRVIKERKITSEIILLI